METHMVRGGRFRIDDQDVRRDPLRLLPIFARCVVVDCRYDFCRAAYAYMAISPDFDEIPYGSEAPLYEWVAREERGKVVAVEARRLSG